MLMVNNQHTYRIQDTLCTYQTIPKTSVFRFVESSMFKQKVKPVEKMALDTCNMLNAMVFLHNLPYV